MFYFPRGGNRGGSDQFKWDDVKTDKHREFYLGHSVKAPVGRWQEGKDLTWYAKDKKDEQSKMKKEFNSVRNAEKEAMMIALGQIPPKSSNAESNKNCDEPQQVHKLKKRSSDSKHSSKKKKKKKKKERRETSDSSSSEDEKATKKRKHHKHNYRDSSESEEERKVKKKKYRDYVESDGSRLKFESRKEHRNKNRDVRDRDHKRHEDGKHKTLRRQYKSDSDGYTSSSSERELKRRKRKDRRRKDEKLKQKY